MIDTAHPLIAKRPRRRVAFLPMVIGCCLMWAAGNLFAVEAGVMGASSTVAGPRYNINSFAVDGDPLLSSNVLRSVFLKHAGTNLAVDDIVKAAVDLQTEYRNEGYQFVSVAFAKEQIANGVVTFNVFESAVPQIVVSGVRYFTITNGMAIGAGGFATNAAPVEISTRDQNGRVHVIPSKTGPRFDVKKYQITGNSVLMPETIAGVLTNIDGAYGTNVSFEGIRTVVSELQGSYRAHGYMTVSVGLPPQKLTNAVVKVRVTEGRLADINVKDNRYFSSNNVMESLPGLHPGMILNGPIFQSELNRANANQDRQIYPVVSQGPEPGTSDLTLKVKDQLPLHAKLVFNNEASPGTPELRVNSSAVYNNLWQMEHALGVAYNFSPQEFKQDSRWDFYDRPLVANYSGFYRMPLGDWQSVGDVVSANSGTFGYNEATRKFNLPPPANRPDLTFFASRATIDTGLEDLSDKVLLSEPGVRTISEDDVQQGLTITEDLGAHLNSPLQTTPNFSSDFSAGVDFKSYQTSNNKTNNFEFTEINLTAGGMPLPPIVSTLASPVPPTVSRIEYLPLSLHYDATWHDALGTTAFGLGVSANVWYDSVTAVGTTNIDRIRGQQSVQQITGSTRSTGYWVVANPTFSRTLVIRTNWVTTFRADGQIANEPLISNEQYGIGGVNSVRGYQEGQVFGDNGWHVTLEQQTPPHVVGIVYGKNPLTIRGTVFMDYAQVFLLDPQGRSPVTSLWGTGFGFVGSVGPHWDARFLFSLPLVKTATTEAYVPFFNFSLTAQF